MMASQLGSSKLQPSRLSSSERSQSGRLNDLRSKKILARASNEYNAAAGNYGAVLEKINSQENPTSESISSYQNEFGSAFGQLQGAMTNYETALQKRKRIKGQFGNERARMSSENEYVGDFTSAQRSGLNYSKEKQDLLTALDVEDPNVISKEATEYDTAAADYMARLTKLNQGEMVTNVQGELRMLANEKVNEQMYLNRLGSFTPSGTYDERYEQILGFANTNQDIFNQENSYFASKNYTELLDAGQKQGQNLTGLGFDLNVIKGKATQFQKVLIPSTERREIWNYQKKRWDDAPGDSYGGRSYTGIYHSGNNKPLQYRTVGTPAHYEDQAKDPNAEYIAKYDESGKLIKIQAKAQKYQTYKSESSEGWGEFTPYEATFDASGNLISETENTQYNSKSYNWRGGDYLREYGVSAAKKATYTNGQIQQIHKYGTYNPSTTSGTGYSWGNNSRFLAEDVSFDTGKLKEKNVLGTYRSNYEMLNSIDKKNPTLPSGYANVNYANWSNQGIYQQKKIDYKGNMVTDWTAPIGNYRNNYSELLPKIRAINDANNKQRNPEQWEKNNPVTKIIAINPSKGTVWDNKGTRYNMPTSKGMDWSESAAYGRLNTAFTSKTAKIKRTGRKEFSIFQY